MSKFARSLTVLAAVLVGIVAGLYITAVGRGHEPDPPAGGPQGGGPKPAQAATNADKPPAKSPATRPTSRPASQPAIQISVTLVEQSPRATARVDWSKVQVEIRQVEQNQPIPDNFIE